VIVRNFNMVRITVIPFETYAPLLIDTDSILPFSIPGKGMKFVCWERHEEPLTVFLPAFQRLENGVPVDR